MSELEEAVKTLTDLGWSEYESKTYTALVLQGISTASQIAKKSQVPPNRVYQILDKLSEKGHVQRMVGRSGGPSKFLAVNPQQVLDKDKNEHELLLDNARSALVQLQERESDLEIPITFTIMGRSELNVYLKKMISSATEEILIALDTLIEVKYGGLMSVIDSKSTHVPTRILTTERGINDEYEQDVLRSLKEIEIKVSEDTFSAIFVVVDGKQVLFTSYAKNIEVEDEDESDDEIRNQHGLYTKDVQTAGMFKRMFELSWESATVPNVD